MDPTTSTASKNFSSGTPLARKLPARLRERLSRRHPPSSSTSSSSSSSNANSSPDQERQDRVTDRRERLLALRQLRTGAHNQRVTTSRVKQEVKRVLQSYRTAQRVQRKLDEATARRDSQLKERAGRARQQNRGAALHAWQARQLQEARTETQRLQQEQREARAQHRRRKLEFLRTQGAALHNERVALTKDYIKISDYIEDVSDNDDTDAASDDHDLVDVVEDADGDEDEDGDTDDNEGLYEYGYDDEGDDGLESKVTILNANFDEEAEEEDEDYMDDDDNDDEEDDEVGMRYRAGEGKDSEGGLDDYDPDYDHEGDQWSNMVNVGDEESYADSYHTRGSSTGHGSAAVTGKWDLGRSLLLHAYSSRFRRRANLYFGNA